MNFVLTPEQRDVGAVAQKFLAQELPLPRIRELAEAADTGSAPLAIDDATWSRCADMGWFALGIPESLGGVGCGPIEEFMLFTELGRQLAPGPFVSTVIAGWISAAAGAEELAGDLFEGRVRAGPAGRRVRARRRARRAGGPPPGDSRRHLPGREPDVRWPASTRRCAWPGPCSVARWPRSTIRSCWPRAQLLVSAMELGIADAVLSMSVDYAKTRTQFGKPIGTFQAVKHRCADMAMRVHASRAQTMFASFHVDGRAPDAAFQSAAAKIVSTKAAKLNTGDNVQNHGAIGFTVEHDAGLFARRAHMCEFMLGGDATAGVSMLEADRHRFETLPAPVEQWFAAAPSS